MGLGAIDNFQETVAPVPPSPSDLLVGRTLFVSSQGLGGAYEDLTYHYSSIDAALAAVTSNLDCVIVFPGNWTVTGDVPTANRKLNLQLTPGASVTINSTMANCGSINCGGFGNLFIEQQLAACASLIFNGNMFDYSGIDGSAECDYVINAVVSISLDDFTTSANQSYKLTSASVYLGSLSFGGAFDLSIQIVATEIFTQYFEWNNNPAFSQVCQWTGKIIATQLPGLPSFLITGASGEPLSDAFKLNGDIHCVGDLEVFNVDGCILNYSNFSIIHSLVTNDITTRNIFMLVCGAVGGYILKSCNLRSSNAVRQFGLIQFVDAANVCTVDSVTAVDESGDIVSLPNVIDLPFGMVVNGISGMASDAFGDWFDPVLGTNGVTGGNLAIVPNLFA